MSKRNENKEVKRKAKKTKIIRINLSLVIGIIVAFFVLLSSIASYKIATIGTDVLYSLSEELAEDIENNGETSIEENTEDSTEENIEDISQASEEQVEEETNETEEAEDTEEVTSDEPTPTGLAEEEINEGINTQHDESENNKEETINENNENTEDSDDGIAVLSEDNKETEDSDDGIAASSYINDLGTSSYSLWAALGDDCTMGDRLTNATIPVTYTDEDHSYSSYVQYRRNIHSRYYAVRQRTRGTIHPWLRDRHWRFLLHLE